jgi:hypothetical protein
MSFVPWFSEAMSSAWIIERKTTGAVFDIVARLMQELILFARLKLNREN